MLTPWKKSYDQARQHIKKQRYYFADTGAYTQRCGFFFYFFCDLLVIQQIVVQLPYVGIFNSFSPVIKTNLTALWSEKMLEMISIFLRLPRLDLWPRMFSILEKVSRELEKKVKFINLG